MKIWEPKLPGTLWATPGLSRDEFTFIYIDIYTHFTYTYVWRVPVVALSKAWVYGRSPAEIVGSNPTGGMDVCLL
jgi:hypothetical protein